MSHPQSPKSRLTFVPFDTVEPSDAGQAETAREEEREPTGQAPNSARPERWESLADADELHAPHRAAPKTSGPAKASPPKSSPTSHKAKSEPDKKAAYTDTTRADQQSKQAQAAPVTGVSDYPCGHPRPSLILGSTEFDVMCRTCYAPFFKHPTIPFVLFIFALGATYFWRPVPLPWMIFGVFALYLSLYVAAALRRRRAQQLLFIGVFATATAFFVSQHLTLAAVGGNRLVVSIIALLLLAGVILGGFIGGAIRIIRREPTSSARFTTAAVVVSLGATLTDYALQFAAASLPVLGDRQSFAIAKQFFDQVQHYKVTIVLLFLAIVALASGVSAIHIVRQTAGAWTLRGAVTLVASVLRKAYEIMVTTTRHTLTNLARVFASAGRSMILVGLSLLLVYSAGELAQVAASSWERTTFLVTVGADMFAVMLWVLLGTAASWGIIATVASEQKVGGGWYESASFAATVILDSLVISTGLYWASLSAVIGLAWLVIGAFRYNEYSRWAPSYGVIFCATLLGSLVLVLSWKDKIRGQPT